MPVKEHLEIADRVRGAYKRHLGDERGFLPPLIPLDRLPEPFDPYIRACTELPRHFPAELGGVRQWLDEIFKDYDPDVSCAIDTLNYLEQLKLMTVLSILAHTYRWDAAPPRPEMYALAHLDLPAALDQPWTHLAKLLEQPRVGTMWSMLLCNWKLATKPGGSSYTSEELTGESLQISHGWLPPPFDAQLERWILTFVEIEARGAVVIKDIVNAVQAAAKQDEQQTTYLLDKLYLDTTEMTHVYMTNIRKSVIDVETWAGMIGQTFAWGLETAEGRLQGSSGMQLGGLASLNSALDIKNESPLAKACIEARKYMTGPQRTFLETLDEARPIIRSFVDQSNNQILKHRFNDCIKALLTWRVAHQKRGMLYLRGQGPRLSTGLTMVDGKDHIEQFRESMEQRTNETNETLVSTKAVTALTIDSALPYLTQEERQLFLQQATRKTYQKDDIILKQGSRYHGLYIVHKGQVRIEVEEKITTVVGYLGPGALFGEMAFLRNVGASASIVADEEVDVDVISRENVYTLLDSRPELSSHLYQSLALLLAQRLQETLSQMLSLNRSIAMQTMSA